MSVVAVKPQHQPRFDHEKARRLREQGLSYARIASILEVSETAVWMQIAPGAAAAKRRIAESKKGAGTCEDCGGPMHADSHRSGASRCVPCSVVLRTTSVREDALQCTTCQRWLPDEAFYRNASHPHRRGRHRQCRACNNASRGGYRASHRDAENRRQREARRLARRLEREEQSLEWREDA